MCVICFAGRVTSIQDVKHYIRRDRYGNISVTGLTLEPIDPNNSTLVEDIMQASTKYEICLLVWLLRLVQ